MGTRTWKGTTSALVETPDSPKWELGDSTKKTRIYRADFDYAEGIIGNFAKGVAGSGDDAGFTIANSSLVKEKGGAGLLTVVYEQTGSSGGGELPPEEFSVTPENLNPRTERLPRFRALGNTTLNLVRDATQGADADLRDAAYAELVLNHPAAALDLVMLLELGHETYYLPGLRYVWTQHSWTTPTTTRGGYIQPPQGPLAGYFASDIDFLRESDALDYSGGIYRLTSSWVGGPYGHWSSDIYPV